MPTGTSLRHEVVVGDLQERVHSRWLVGLAVSPGTYLGQRREDRSVRRQEEAVTPCLGPFGQLVSERLHFVAYLLDAEDVLRLVAGHQPVQKAGQKSRP